VRRDALGCYGHHPRHAPTISPTPALDRLAGEGVRMVDAYAPSPWTLPSHLSLMTGVPPLVHGVETEVGTLDPSLPTLAEILKRAGYRTAGVYSAPYLEPHWGFGRGFDEYRAEYAPAVVAGSQKASEIRAQVERVVAASDWRRYDELKRQEAAIVQELNRSSELASTSDQVGAAVISRIEDLARDATPWFLFAHFFDVHCDYVPPAPYDTRFDPDYTGSANGAGCLGGEWVGRPDPARPGALIRAISDRDLEHVVALYEGEVAWVDAHVESILRALDARALARTTLVIVVSDHGEEFFEHGNVGHRHGLYEEELRVPMILRLPGVLPEGASVRGPVSLTDVLPTILDVLGLEGAGTSGGTSFLPLIRGTEEAGHRSVLYRLVMMFGGDVQVDAARHVVLRQVMVEDGFRTGPIKITRTRRWPQFPSDVGADLKQVFDREAASQYAREELEWIDVERFANEDRSHVADRFTDPGARDALDAFRRQYTDLVARRRRQTSALPQNVRVKLESLGYVDRSGPEFPEPDVVLPPPSPAS
jgi:arylsulfatase A-like enzyme